MGHEPNGHELHGSEPRDPEEFELEAGMQAGFGPYSESEAAPSSVLFALKQLVGSSRKVLLREDVEAALVAPVRGVPEDLRAALPQGRRNYRILGELARGGMGVVLKGHDGDLGRDVALKVLHRKLAREAEPVQRFIEEAQISGQLQHPGIVPIYEVGLIGGERPYFAMKLVKGKTLAALLAERETPASERRRFLSVFEQVCQTIAYAHSRGVIHRDLKPSNVMVGAFGEVQVLDWGLAKVLASGGTADEERAAASRAPVTRIETVRSGSDWSHSRAGSIMGTPAYMAPEQARGENERLDERCDVFALGAILCELLTVRPPYVGDRDEILRLAAAARLDDAFARLAACDADAELVELARRCLSPSIESRPRNAGVVARIVQEHLARAEDRAHVAEVAAARAEAKATAERRARRLTLALGGTVLAVILGSGGAWFAFDHHERTRRDRLAGSARAALSDATFARGKGDPEAALAAVGRAEAVAAHEEIDASLGIEITSLRGALEAELAERAARREQETRERELLAALEQASIDESDLRFSIDVNGSAEVTDGQSRDRRFTAVRDAAYEAAFRAFGLDFRTRSDDELIETLRSTRSAVAIAIYLDQWALIRRRLEEAPEVERLVRIAHRIDPDPPRCRLRDAVFAGNHEELSKLAAASRDGDLPAQTLLILALAVRGHLGLAAAVDVLQPSVRAHPGDFHLRYLLAALLDQAEPPRRQEALPHAAAALALQPTSIAAAALHIGILQELDRGDDALPEALGLVRRAPDSYLPWMRLASLRGERGEYDESMRCARKAIELDPLRAAPHHLLALSLTQKGQEAEAIQERREAARLNEHYLLRLADSLRQSRQLDEAIETYRRAVRVDPIAAWHGLHHAYLDKGDVASAVEAVRNQLAAASESTPAVRATVLFDLGTVLGLSGDTEASLARWRESLALAPGDAHRLEWLAFKLFYAKHFDEALETFRQLNPADPYAMLLSELKELRFKQRREVHKLHEDALGFAALARRKLVDASEAIAAFDAALAADPDHVDTLVELTRFLTLDPAADGFDPERAMDLIDRVVELAPEQPGVKHVRGLVLHRIGRHDESVEALQAAIAAAPEASGSVEDWLVLSMAYHELGEEERAIECFRRVGQEPRPGTSLDPAAVARLDAEARALLGLDKETDPGR